MNAAPQPQLHTAECGIWDVPEEAAPEALLAAGIRDEALIAYGGAVRPLYDAMKRVLGQLSGLLILMQTGVVERERHATLFDVARAQLAEARDRLNALRAPSAAARHAALLAEIGEGLDGVCAAMAGRLDLVGPAGADLDRIVARLFALHRRLLAASDDRAGMTPVDFRHACCNCGAAART